MHKINFYKVSCVVLIIAICVTLIWGKLQKENILEQGYNDGIEQLDIDSIYLDNSGIQVDFAEIIASEQEETRKLIVSTQEATVSIELTDKLIKNIDYEFLKKTQKVSYTGMGYFVVDLDNLTKENIIQDKKNQTVTIQIEHAYLETIEINPDNIIINEVKEGLLAKGEIELTVKDYNSIEKELIHKMEAEFKTAENGQNADAIALRMVKEVYAPIIKAIDSDYTLNVEFK